MAGGLLVADVCLIGEHLAGTRVTDAADLQEESPATSFKSRFDRGATLHCPLMRPHGEDTRDCPLRSVEFDAESGELRKQGRKIRLPDQPTQILALLLERPGEVVTRDAVRQRLWPADTFVDFDAGLNSATKKLRDALGDPAENPQFVETLPRRGYRFIAPVTVTPNRSAIRAGPR